ncbi:hypothetical protein ABFT80_14090 [Mesorhizobium sp. SB112]|uniref:hypothetical protein n=1 Tax=Mesorhizobium sp. SB112 TaxID=3151853 RepID=UPI0032679AEA
MFKTLIASLLMSLFSTHTSYAQQDKPDPHGAVMCVWMVYASLERIVEECGTANRDAKFFQTFQSNVDRMEAFIFRNSEITRAHLDKYLVGLSRENQRDLCAPSSDHLRMYEIGRERGGDALTQDIDKLLEVERPPVFNPCL